MDVSHPVSSLVPTLDGPVLQVLVRTDRPLTGRQIWRLADAGSEGGVRRVLSRLVEQGVVLVAEAGQALLYVGNRDHVAWPAVELLTGLRSEFLARLAREFESWAVRPVTAAMFGSAARADGDSDSDIDLLLIHPAGVDEDEGAWAMQVDRLRERVLAWTGNRCQVYQCDDQARPAMTMAEPLISSLAQDSITVFGRELRQILRLAQAVRTER